jgi:hypothetical protein
MSKKHSSEYFRAYLGPTKRKNSLDAPDGEPANDLLEDGSSSRTAVIGGKVITEAAAELPTADGSLTALYGGPLSARRPSHRSTTSTRSTSRLSFDVSIEDENLSRDAYDADGLPGTTGAAARGHIRAYTDDDGAMQKTGATIDAGSSKADRGLRRGAFDVRVETA